VIVTVREKGIFRAAEGKEGTFPLFRRTGQFRGRKHVLLSLLKRKEIRGGEGGSISPPSLKGRGRKGETTRLYCALRKDAAPSRDGGKEPPTSGRTSLQPAIETRYLLRGEGGKKEHLISQRRTPFNACPQGGAGLLHYGGGGEGENLLSSSPRKKGRGPREKKKKKKKRTPLIRGTNLHFHLQLREGGGKTPSLPIMKKKEGGRKRRSGRVFSCQQLLRGGGSSKRKRGWEGERCPFVWGLLLFLGLCFSPSCCFCGFFPPWFFFAAPPRGEEEKKDRWDEPAPP